MQQATGPHVHTSSHHAPTGMDILYIMIAIYAVCHTVALMLGVQLRWMPTPTAFFTLVNRALAATPTGSLAADAALAIVQALEQVPVPVPFVPVYMPPMPAPVPTPMPFVPVYMPPMPAPAYLEQVVVHVPAGTV